MVNINNYYLNSNIIICIYCIIVYPNWLFYFLYAIGIIYIFPTSIIMLFIYDYEMIKLSCFATKVYPWYDIITFILFPVYYLYDWFVLLLYIIKVIQIKNKKELNNYTNAIIIKRVNIQLMKILFLTIFYETWNILFVLINTYFEDNGIIDILVLFIPLDSVITAVIIYFMIEHNHDKYIKLLEIVYKLKICICLYCLINDIIYPENDEKELGKNIEIQVSKVSVQSINTKTMNLTPIGIEKPDNSPMTNTVNVGY